MGSLYGRYDAMWFFWELFNLLTKFCITASVFLFSNNTPGNALRQALFALAVLMVSMTMHSYAGPYDHWVLNQYQFICYIALFVQVGDKINNKSNKYY
eukprot:8430710-Pyramimonas_sp.AAC.1